MVNEVNFVSIKTILNRILRHPLMQDVDMDTAIQYTVDFIGLFGLPKMYEDKIDTVEIKNYRGKIPCNVISIQQVKDKKSGICLKQMTDTFYLEEKKDNPSGLAFKTQGDIIYTSFKEGELLVAYRTMKVDEDGFPMIPNNTVFQKALELYIKQEIFTVLFDQGKIQGAVLQNTQQAYAVAAGQLNSEFTLPSVSEMESITNMFNNLLIKTNEFSTGFNMNGNKSYIKIH